MLPPRKTPERRYATVPRWRWCVTAILLSLATAAAGEEQSAEVRYYPQFTVLTLGSVSFQLDDQDDHGVKRTETTTLGSLDLLVQAVVSDFISILAQPAVDAVEDGGEDFKVEQLQVAYTHSDPFKVRLGKFHTALGYWNRTYHNVPWLRTSIFRPEIFRLEDEGGVLPVHSVGLEVSGVRSAGTVDFSYSLGLVKGRQAILGEAVELDDIGDADALNLHLALRHTSQGGASRAFELGLSGYAETIPEDLTPGGRRGEIEELILGAYVVWTVVNGELVTEYLRIRHHDVASGQDFDSAGFYYQYSLVFKRWKIYERLDVVSFDAADPYFAGLADRRDIRRSTTGVRWEVRPWLGLTAEYSWASRDGLADSNRLALQLAFSLGPWK